MVIAVVAVNQTDGVGVPVIVAEAVAKIGGVAAGVSDRQSGRNVGKPEAVGGILKAEIQRLVNLFFSVAVSELLGMLIHCSFSPELKLSAPENFLSLPENRRPQRLVKTPA
jgi:hypothetical protein